MLPNCYTLQCNIPQYTTTPSPTLRGGRHLHHNTTSKPLRGAGKGEGEGATPSTSTPGTTDPSATTGSAARPSRTPRPSRAARTAQLKAELGFDDVRSLREDATLASEFFWVVVISTTAGLLASFTRARELEGVGASKFGVLFIFLLVAIIGTRMDVAKILDAPAFMAIGAIWMLFHIVLLLVVAKIIKAPFFFVAVGSKANVGGAASAPVVAGAFHPALAPVGVLLAVLGYALGTYGAILCAQLMAGVG